MTITPAVDMVIDGSFETPSLDPNTFQQAPQDSAWQFSQSAGVARNGSAFVTNWIEAQNAPAGAQVAYLQDAGSMSQTVYLDAGTYQLSFLAAQRAIYQSHYEEIEVVVDNNTGSVQDAGTIDPVNTSYGAYQSAPFTVTTGIHTIEFLGVNPVGGDNTAFIDQVGLFANAINDGSFEAPALAAGAYQYSPSGSPWLFAGGAGVATNGSGFTSGNSYAPDGNQVAFIQENGSITESVDLITGSYAVSFAAAQRANAPNQSQEIEVLLDSTQVIGLITPSSTSYGSYETLNFAVTGGIHTIKLVGMNPQGGDNTALVDAVSLTATNDQITDGGFETPVLAGNSYLVAPGDSAWQFSGLAGVTGNNSGLTSNNGYAPQGAQVGFLMNQGSMSQTVYLDANTYNLSFMAAQRAIDQTQSQTIEVQVINAQTGVGALDILITPAVTSGVNDNTYAYTLYQTPTFTVTTPAPYVIKFIGTSPANGESTALIDAVALATVQDTFVDGGFESPVLAADGYQFAPPGSAWTFTQAAGVTADNSGFTYVIPNFQHNGYSYGSVNAPDGAQVAFIKDNGSASQTIDLDSGTYGISFLAAQRIEYQTQNQTLEVQVSNAQTGAIVLDTLITPVTGSITSGSNVYYTYSSYQTANFTIGTASAPAGAYNVAFIGQSPTSADSTAFIDDVTLATGGSVSDGNFEDTALLPNSYQFAPSGGAWSFTGASGVSTDGVNDKSGFTQGNPIAPVGNQVAFIKDNGTMSQSVYLVPDVEYSLSFMAAQRNLYQTQSQTIQVSVAGVGVVGITTPDAPLNGIWPAGTTFGLYQTSNFTVNAEGWYTITFAGLSPTTADSTAFINDVQLNS